MTAAEWLAAMRAAGVTVFLDPNPKKGFLLLRPANLAYDAWRHLDDMLEDVGRKAIFAELRREADEVARAG